MRTFPLRTRQGYPLFLLLFNIVLILKQVLVTVIRQEKSIRGTKIGKEVRPSLVAGDMMIYLENLKRINDKTQKEKNSI